MFILEINTSVVFTPFEIIQEGFKIVAKLLVMN